MRTYTQISNPPMFLSVFYLKVGVHLAQLFQILKIISKIRKNALISSKTFPYLVYFYICLQKIIKISLNLKKIALKNW